MKRRIVSLCIALTLMLSFSVAVHSATSYENPPTRMTRTC